MKATIRQPIKAALALAAAMLCAVLLAWLWLRPGTLRHPGCCGTPAQALAPDYDNPPTPPPTADKPMSKLNPATVKTGCVDEDDLQCDCTSGRCKDLRHPEADQPQPVNSIDASVEEFTHGYLQWAIHRPDVVQKGKPLKLEMPAIDLYSPSGVSIYYGTDSVENAAFLRTLPEGIREAKTTVVRPSLREAIEMLAAFKANKDALLSDSRYTVFAITYSDWDRCKEQNAAVAKLKARELKTNIRILEVRLHQ